MTAVGRTLVAAAAALWLGACATAGPAPETGPPAPPPSAPARTAAREAPAPVPETFESEDFFVTTARTGDTPADIAGRLLGDPGKAWMIEDFNGTATITTGQEVIVPKRPWNPSGVESTGYQLVPVLTYHDIGPQAKGRLVIGVKSFEEQMRYLKEQGYRVISLSQFHEFLSLKRQLPRRSVVVTFDDGYKSFLRYAYPVLKELGFTATLFVYTDYVGAGRNALSWDDLATLAAEGFQVEGHSKTHSDLRRRQGESEADHSRRMRAEMEGPQKLFEQRLGRPARFLAYPYGAADDDVVQRTREHGFVGGLTVFREGNASFAPLFRIRRSQIYSEMTLDDFVKNLNTFAAEPIR
ncbi:MAG TPA: polysaccharide deacetylase family protein [Candidatus Limnocylindria bacterium]|nr:polysaccharide deacetylase family protein [Candidatus Limnocylindria bacterium]